MNNPIPIKKSIFTSILLLCIFVALLGGYFFIKGNQWVGVSLVIVASVGAVITFGLFGITPDCEPKSEMKDKWTVELSQDATQE